MNAPVSLVIVCVVESLFVHVTDEPIFTVIVPGENEKLDKITEFAEVVDVVPADSLEGCEEYAEQPENIVATTAMMTISAASFLIMFLPPYPNNSYQILTWTMGLCIPMAIRRYAITVR